MTIEKITLTYFDIRGRMEPVRLMLEDASQPYVDCRVFDWKALKADRDLLPFAQLPVASIGNVSIAQGDAIMRYFARELGYYGKSNIDAMNIDMIAGAVEDIKIPYARVIYGGKFDEEVCAFVAKAIEWLSNINLFIQRFSCGLSFIAGDAVSFADFLMYEQLITLTYLEASILNTFPLLQGYMTRIESRVNIEAYLKSKRRPRMVNNNPNGTPASMLL